MYPTAVNEIEELKTAFSGQVFPGAKKVAETLVTLPTHHLLTDRDKKAICGLLTSTASSEIPQVRDIGLGAGVKTLVPHPQKTGFWQMATLFWSAVFFIFYAYLGYPLLLMLLSLIKSRPVKKGDVTPSVSFIVTAHNEEARIREKLENTMALDYPRNRLEIIVASDCSTDETDAIVQSYESRGVRLVRAAQRNGKEAAQKLAVQAASGEILIFSDVATILQPDAVRNIVKNFADPTVGCVSSVDKIIDAAGKVSGEGAYVRYEMLLRDLETRANTLVGLSGSFLPPAGTSARIGSPNCRATSILFSMRCTWVSEAYRIRRALDTTKRSLTKPRSMNGRLGRY